MCTSGGILRIALINPGLGMRKNRPFMSLATMEPLWMAILAGLTPRDIVLKGIDDRFEAVPYDEPWDLVAVSAITFTARRAYEIADQFRKRNRRVVLGGFHPSFCPEESLEHADAVAIGEAEAVWPQILEDLRQGKLQGKYQADIMPAEIRSLPDRSILQGRRYLPLSIVEFSRGCPHDCEFCAARVFYKHRVRYRTIEDVLDDIRSSGRNLIFFADDNLFADRGRAKALLRALVPLNVRWACQASIEFTKELELLELMVASGCQCVILGLESVRSSNLTQMGKGWIKKYDYEEALGRLREYGVAVYGSFVFGYDEDDPTIFRETYDFIQREKFFIVQCNILQAYPGTRLYARLQKEGRLIYDRWWINPAYSFGEATFRPKGMSPEELTDGCLKLRQQVHTISGVARRLINVRGNASSLKRAILFLLANLVSGQDMARKRKLRLGHEAR